MTQHSSEQPKKDPCYTDCDECQRHECNMAGECLASDPEKVERKEAYNRSRPHPAPAQCSYFTGDSCSYPMTAQYAEIARQAQEELLKITLREIDKGIESQANLKERIIESLRITQKREGRR